MATFGTTSGGNTYRGLGANAKRAGRYQLAEAGLITKLTCRVQKTTCKAKGVIYADSSGAPGSLIATSNEISISGTGSGWYDFPFAAAVNLSPGYYWLGIHSDADGASLGLYCVTSGGTARDNADTYSDGPADPFGAGTDRIDIISIYATYTPSVGAGFFFHFMRNAA